VQELLREPNARAAIAEVEFIFVLSFSYECLKVLLVLLVSMKIKIFVVGVMKKFISFEDPVAESGIARRFYGLRFASHSARSCHVCTEV